MANRFGAILTDDLSYPCPGYPTVGQWNLLKNAAALNAGGHVYSLHGIGVYDGWRPTSDKTCTAGLGIVGTDGFVGVTTESKAITGLTSGVLNYVYALPNSDTVETGDVDFAAYPTLVATAGYVLLGSLTLNGAGTVTHINGIAVGEDYEELWERDDLFQLKRGKAHGEDSTAVLEPTDAEQVEIDHSDQDTFSIPGAVSVVLSDANFSCLIVENAQADCFTLLLTNDGAYSASCDYSWVRLGIV